MFFTENEYNGFTELYFYIDEFYKNRTINDLGIFKLVYRNRTVNAKYATMYDSDNGLELDEPDYEEFNEIAFDDVDTGEGFYINYTNMPEEIYYDGKLIVKKHKQHIALRKESMPTFCGNEDDMQRRSIVTIDIEKCQDLIYEFAGKGNMIGDDKEEVDFGILIGFYIDIETGKGYPTTRGIIHYTKTGTYIVPSRPNENVRGSLMGFKPEEHNGLVELCRFINQLFKNKTVGNIGTFKLVYKDRTVNAKYDAMYDSDNGLDVNDPGYEEFSEISFDEVYTENGIYINYTNMPEEIYYDGKLIIKKHEPRIDDK